MGKIGKAIGYQESASDDLGMQEPGAEVGGKEPAGADVLAMKQFMRATSPEEKAQAMKDFLEACGCMG